MKKIFILLLLSFTIIFAKNFDISKIKEGDIILIQNSEAISKIFEDFCDSKYSTMGILHFENNIWNILKMDSSCFSCKGGVYLYSLNDYLKMENTKSIKILRPKYINNLSKKMKNYLINEANTGSKNIGYDYSYQLKNNNNLYCTELVYYIYPEIFDLSITHYTLKVLCDNNIIKNNVQEVYQWER